LAEREDVENAKKEKIIIIKYGRYQDKRLSFDSAQDDVRLRVLNDVTLSGVEALSRLKLLVHAVRFLK